MDVKAIEKISVLGSGLMGSGIAQIFGSYGYQVTVYDVNPGLETAMRDRLRSNLELVLADQADRDKTIAEINGRIRFIINFQEAAESADFVVECAPENMQLKQEIFSNLDNICREDVPLASNTSVMSITEIGSQCKGRQRIIGTHFWNPPFLLPLVEVVRTVHTEEPVIELTMSLLQHVGKHPILVKKDVPGFVVNRLQHSMWREAISIVEKGIADAKTVDEAIKNSFGLRLPVMAPMENSDMVGTDLVLSIHEYLFPHLDNSPEPSPYLKKLVADGHLGFKSGQGFMSWSKEEQEALQSKLVKHLVRLIRKD